MVNSNSIGGSSNMVPRGSVFSTKVIVETSEILKLNKDMEGLSPEMRKLLRNGLQLRVNAGRLQLKAFEAKIKRNEAKAEENIRQREANRKEKAAQAREKIKKNEAERITKVMKNMNAANTKRNREIMFSMTLLSIFMAAICYSNYYAIEYMLNGNANKPPAESALTSGAQFAKGSCWSKFYPNNVNVNSEEYKSKGYWGKKFAGWDPLTGMRGIITQECIEAAIDTIGGTLSKTGGRGAELIGHAGENIVTGAKGLSRPTLHAVNVIACIAIVFATLIWKVMNAEKSSALRRELEGVANMSTKTPAQQKSYLRRAGALSVKLLQKVPVTPLGLVRLLPKPRIPKFLRWGGKSTVKVRGNENVVQNAHNNYLKLNNKSTNEPDWIAKKVRMPRAQVSVLLSKLREKERAKNRQNAGGASSSVTNINMVRAARTKYMNYKRKTPTSKVTEANWISNSTGIVNKSTVLALLNILKKKNQEAKWIKKVNAATKRNAAKRQQNAAKRQQTAATSLVNNYTSNSNFNISSNSNRNRNSNSN